MDHELEIVSHSKMGYLNILTVRLMSRTPHIHKDYEVGLILHGCVSLRVGDHTHRLDKGGIYLVNSLEAHEFLSDEGALILAIQISGDFLDSFIPDSPGIRFTGSPDLSKQLSSDPEALNIMRALCVGLAINYYSAPEKAHRCFSLAAALISLLREKLPFEQLSTSELIPIRKRTERLISILDYIDANFTRKLLLEEIAEREGLTLFYLSHLFKDTLGISFQNYLKQKRFEYAYHLVISTNRSILDISLESGFSDARYLNTLFRENFGCSAAEYREHASAGQSRAVMAAGSEQSFLTSEAALTLLTSSRSEYMEAVSPAALSSFLF